MTTFFKRLYWAARLDWLTFEEIKADPNALPQALAILFVLGLVEATTAVWDPDGSALSSFFLTFVAFWLSWVIEIWLLWRLGNWMRTRTDTPTFSQVARTTTFALSPAVFFVLGFTPWVGGILVLVVLLWYLAALAQALRVTFGFQSWWDGIVLLVVPSVIFFIPDLIVILVFYLFILPR